ncbi:hypothetical protein D3C71_1404650 [compost metagenome]
MEQTRGHLVPRGLRRGRVGRAGAQQEDRQEPDGQVPWQARLQRTGACPAEEVLSAFRAEGDLSQHRLRRVRPGLPVIHDRHSRSGRFAGRPRRHAGQLGMHQADHLSGDQLVCWEQAGPERTGS